MATYGITQDWRNFLNQRSMTSGQSATGQMEPLRLAELRDLRARAYDTEQSNIQKESLESNKAYQSASLDLQRSNSLMNYMQTQAGLEASQNAAKMSSLIQAPLALASAYKVGGEAYGGLKDVATSMYDYFQTPDYSLPAAAGPEEYFANVNATDYGFDEADWASLSDGMDWFSDWF